ncbi:molybdopterin-dependent oxidoreductase, partial [Sphingomonas sp.]|uniref:molybdopterin-dependent oxidoreductase n=1 Tax=Sphingomonas sp. TaxID=28214 RepID=UPI003B3ACDC2
FNYRPWELKKTESIDVMDALGSAIRIDARGPEVMRVLPRINEEINEEWASDKTRHAVDGLVRRRLDKPYRRKDGKLVPVTWGEAFDAIAAVNAGSSVAAVAGPLVDCETLYAAKVLLRSMGSDLLEGRDNGLTYDTSSLAAVNFNSTIAGIETADAILLVGSNVRWEAPLVNTRIRKAVKRGAKVWAIGPEVDLTYPVTWLGNDLSLLGNLPGELTDLFAKAQRPAVIVGGGAIKAAQGATLALVDSLGLIKDGWNGYNVLHISAARMGGLMLGYARTGGMADIVAAAPKLLFLLGAEDVAAETVSGSFKVYVGHHGDRGAALADVILPAAAYSEKPGTYVNLEGRVQRGDRAVFPPGDAREDWAILRALSDVLGHTLPFDSFDALHTQMAAEVPALGNVGAIASFDWSVPSLDRSASGEIAYPIQDFYLTNAIARASDTMHRCSSELLHGESFAEAAE